MILNVKVDQHLLELATSTAMELHQLVKTYSNENILKVSFLLKIEFFDNKNY